MQVPRSGDPVSSPSIHGRGVASPPGSIYLRLMRQALRQAIRRRIEDALAFRPWMLGAAVLLACAIGIGIMELRRPVMWAQADQQAPARP